MPEPMSDITVKFLDEFADAGDAPAVVIEEVSGGNNPIVDDTIMLNQK